MKYYKVVQVADRHLYSVTASLFDIHNNQNKERWVEYYENISTTRNQGGVFRNPLFASDNLKAAQNLARDSFLAQVWECEVVETGNCTFAFRLDFYQIGVVFCDSITLKKRIL